MTAASNRARRPRASTCSATISRAPASTSSATSRGPFGAEIVDGFIWGRGAVDMLNETATMALAFRRLADSGFKPRGTLTYLAVADEEALGTWGAKWLT